MKKLLEHVQGLKSSLLAIYDAFLPETPQSIIASTLGQIKALNAVETYILEDITSPIDRSAHKCTCTERVDD